MVHIPKVEIAPYLDIAKRRKWWIIIPFFLALAAGGVHFYQTPKVYRSSTLILVESQRVPSEFVPNTVSEDLQSRLQTISQQVHSRTNLEDIIRRFELLAREEDKEPGLPGKIKRKVLTFVGLMEVSADQNDKEEGEPSMQQVVGNVRSKINVNLRAKNQAFEISFEWGDPQVAAQVTNALASQFIERNLRVREEMAMGTTRFLDSEVQRLRQELQKRENRLEEFKHRNMGRLPGQLESNLNILSQLKEELSRTEDRVEQLRQQKWMIEQQAQIQSQGLLAGSSGQGDDASGQQSLAVLQERLKEMRTKYKDQHPDVQRLKRRISQMEEQGGMISQGQKSDAEPLNKISIKDVEMQQLQMRLEDHQKKMQSVKKQISEYEQRIEQTSEVELELRNLERDYAAVNDRYQNVLRRKLDAEMAEQMERRQQGEQFRVVDPAIAPDKPFKPDMNKVMVMALALGLGLGGGLAYLREALDPAFYTPGELKEQLQVKTVVSLPFVHREKKKRGAERVSDGGME
ncbi:MAG: GNVR domain-containing protein [Desulfovermiculus sp.]|nr:GNVR domain-containing protein [Desulfovermiculus sp.]